MSKIKKIDYSNVNYNEPVSIPLLFDDINFTSKEYDDIQDKSIKIMVKDFNKHYVGSIGGNHGYLVFDDCVMLSNVPKSIIKKGFHVQFFISCVTFHIGFTKAMKNYRINKIPLGVYPIIFYIERINQKTTNIVMEKPGIDELEEYFNY